MIEIFGAIASGLIVAYAIYVAKTHRSLITYEIVSIRHEVRIEGDKIVPSGNEYLDTCINSIRLKLVNRGWKDAHNLDLHYPGIADPFSIRKIAESINPNTIELNDIPADAGRIMGRG